MNRRTFLTAASGFIAGCYSLPEIVAEELVLEVDWELKEADIAFQNLEKFPKEERGYYAYLSTCTVEGEYRDSLGEVLKVIIPSLCHKTSLKEQLPVQVSETLYRINLFQLGWLPNWHKVLSQHYPYYPNWIDRKKQYPLVIRADWFCADIFDESQTGDAQHLFLYAGAVPKNRADYYKFWGVQENQEYVYGMIEGESGVAVNDKSGLKSMRHLENLTTSKRGYAWRTRDSRKVTGVFDPFQNIALGPEGFQYDASEYITGMYKVMGQKSGCLQSYLLTDGNKVLKQDAKGKVLERQTQTRQAKAPVDIVEEKNNIRGREICNGASCIHCHPKGIVPPTSNRYVKYIKADTQLFLDEKSKPEVERYHGSDLEREILYNQQLYNDGVRMCCNLSAAEFSAAYTEVVRQYVGQVDLARLSREMGLLYGTATMTPAELEKALAYGSKYNTLTLDAAEIAEGETISRDSVIENFPRFQKVVDLWQARPKS